ncbi:MAG: FHA domain-containing protein, partial [Myxococcota bacterium]
AGLRRSQTVLPTQACRGWAEQAQVELDLAGALVTLVDATGLMDRRDRGHLEQAATLYTQHEEFDRAGEVYAQLGYVNKASEAFKRAGNIQRMEEMFQRSETADVAEAEFDRAYDTYEFAVMAGDPLGALEALERCVELHPHDAGLSAKLQVLRERMPRCGRITLTARGGSWILVGGTSVSIGREDDNEILLLSAGVSRRHARLSRRAGAPTLEDAGSRHGTRVGGATISRATPLMDEGQFQIGRELVLDYRFRPGGELPALFEVAGGYLKGQRFVWADRLVTTGIPPDEPEWIPGGLALEFIRGYWHAVPAQSRGTLLINGQSATVPTLLRLRDELVFDGVTLTVE